MNINEAIENWKIMLFIVGIVLGIIVLFGGGIFIFRVVNDLILEPVRGGRVTAITLLMLLVFIAVLFSKYRRRGDDDLGRESYREDTIGKKWKRWGL